MAQKDPYAGTKKVLYCAIVVLLIFFGAVVYNYVTTSDADRARINEKVGGIQQGIEAQQQQQAI